MMYSELLARIVLSSSIGQVVFHLLSPILFYLCGCLSFCSLRVGSHPRQMRPHVDPPSALLSPRFHGHIRCTWHIHCTFLLVECDRLSIRHPFLGPSFSLSGLCLGYPVFVCIHPCSSRQSSFNNCSDSFSAFVTAWFDRSSMRCQRSICCLRSSYVVMALVLARCDRTSMRHLLLIYGFHRALFLSFTRSVSATLSLCVFILDFPVNVLSMIGLIRSLLSTLWGLVALPCDASAAQPGQHPV